MKTLAELAKEWRTNIHLVYASEIQTWIAELPEARMCCADPRAEGKSPKEALDHLAKQVRGHRLSFKSSHYFIHHTVPEVITS